MTTNAILIVLFFIAGISAQIYKPDGFILKTEGEGSADRQLGNAMVDMVSSDFRLWAGSGYLRNDTVPRTIHFHVVVWGLFANGPPDSDSFRS